MTCGTTSIQSISEQYETIEGSLLAPPELSTNGRRLFVFVLRASGDKVVCVAINRERKEILAEAQKLLESAVGRPVLIYASPVNEPIEEILGGVDYQIHAMGIWIPAVDRPRLILTGYGDSLMGAMQSVSWQQFLQRMIGKGMDQVL